MINVESGVVSLKTLIAVAVAAIGLGIAWQGVLGTMQENAREVAEIRDLVKGNQTKVDKLTFVICMQDDASAFRCKQLGLLQ